MKKFILILSISLSLTAGFSQEKLSLEEAISIGLENNFDIRIAAKDVDMAKNNVDIGNSGMLPTVTVGGAQNWSYQDLNGLRADETPVEISGARPSSLNANVNLNWTLFDGMRMFFAYRNFGDLADLTDLQRRMVLEDAMSNIILAFYEVYVESERLNALYSTLDISKERFRLAEASYELGRASRLEKQQAQVDYNADQSAYLQQTEVVKTAKINLNLLLAIDPKTEFEVDEEFQISDDLLITQLEENALVKNTGIQIVNGNHKILENEQRMIMAERFPVLNFGAGGSMGRSENPAGFFVVTNTRGYNFGLNLNWTLFNGLDINRRSQNIRIQRDQIEIEKEKVKAQLLADLTTFFVRYQNNAQLVRFEEENLEIAKENAEIALERYKVGKSNPLELREAQVNALQAEIRLLEAKYNLKVAEVNLLRLSGNLVD